MSMTDPIADLFTRLRNACSAGHKKVDVPHSVVKEAVSQLLVEQGFLTEIQTTDVEGRKRMRLYVRTDRDGAPVLRRIERVSKPGCRVYHPLRNIPRVLRCQGLGIFTTSKGILSDRECREQRVGGEYVGRVW